MARKKTKGPSKSKAIRDFMRKNKGASVQQIVDGLKSEGVTAALVYNVQSAMRQKKAVKGGNKNAAAATNGSAGTSKADSIRQVAGGMPKPVRPKDVVAALADQGISVSSAQVSQVLKGMGLKRRRRGRKPAAMAGRATTSISMSESLSLENLLAAKKLVDHLGSVQAAKQAVDALVRLI